MSVGGCALEDWTLQVQILDNFSWSEVEVLFDDVSQFRLGLARGAIVHNSNGKGFSYTNSIRHLNQTPAAKSSFDQGFGNPTGSIGSATIDFGVVLTTESSTAMGTPASISVYDDFTTSEASVSHGTTNDEVTTGVDVIFGIFVQIFGGDYSLDYLFDDILTESGQSHLFRMLGRNNHGVNSGRNASSILKSVITCDLGLCVWSSPPKGSISAKVR